MNLRKMLKKSERGQALAEYVVLFPPVLLISFMVLIPLTARANYIFCTMVYTMNPGAGECDQWLDDPVAEEEEEPPAPEEEECVVLQEELGGSQCDQHEDCTHLEPGLNVGSYDASEDIEAFVIKAGKDYHIFESGLTDDGCYLVEITGNHVSWERYAGGKDCKDVSHEQVWKVPLCE